MALLHQYVLPEIQAYAWNYGHLVSTSIKHICCKHCNSKREISAQSPLEVTINYFKE